MGYPAVVLEDFNACGENLSVPLNVTIVPIEAFAGLPLHVSHGSEAFKGFGGCFAMWGLRLFPRSSGNLFTQRGGRVCSATDLFPHSNTHTGRILGCRATSASSVPSMRPKLLPRRPKPSSPRCVCITAPPSPPQTQPHPLLQPISKATVLIRVDCRSPLFYSTRLLVFPPTPGSRRR